MAHGSSFYSSTFYYYRKRLAALTAKPGKTTSLQAAAISDSEIQISFNAINRANAYEYSVSGDGVTWLPPEPCPAPPGAVIADGLPAGTIFYFRVRGINEHGAGPWSNVASATTLGEEATEQPTEFPTELPTEPATEFPTESPTEELTEPPTEVPTEEPTEPPTEIPTEYDELLMEYEGVLDGVQNRVYPGVAPSRSGGKAPFIYAVTDGALPDGLSLNSSTGAITGAPEVVDTFADIEITVTDDLGTQVADTLSIQVFEDLSVGYDNTNAEQGVPFEYEPFVQGGKAPLSFTVQEGTLPSGLELDAETGEISGTPDTIENQTGIVIRATDNLGYTFDTSEFSIRVWAVLEIAGAPADGVLTRTYNGFTPEVNGGDGNYFFSLVGDPLPTGLGLDNDTGEISGVPSGSAGVVGSLAIMVEDGNGFSALLGPFDIEIFANLTITGDPVDGVDDRAYNGFTPGGGGGKPSRSYAVTAGSLPAGLSLNSNSGAITGTPTTPGTQSNIEITVTDALGYTAVLGPFDIQTFADLTISGSPADGVDDRVYNGFTPTVAGGKPSRSYAITSGTLPAGLSLNSGTGEITGTPTTPGTQSNITLTVTDALGYTAAIVNFDIQVFADLEISGTPPDGEEDEAYTFTPTVSGGKPSLSYAVTAGSLPSGLSLNSSTGEISGTPDTEETESGIEITVTDALGYTDVLGPFDIVIEEASDDPEINEISSLRAVSTGNTIGVPSGVLAGDVIVLWEYANSMGAPAGSVPPGFLPIYNEVSGNNRWSLNYKKADGTEGGTTLTGWNGGIRNRKMLTVFRPNYDAAILAGGGGRSQSNSAPTDLVIPASAAAAPLVVFAGYSVSTGTIDPRGFSPAKDDEYAAATARYLAWKIYMSSPADTTISMEDEGTDNAMMGGWIRFVPPSADPLSVAVIASATATSPSIVVPSSAQDGDTLLLVDTARNSSAGGAPSIALLESGWVPLTDNAFVASAFASSTANVETRINYYMKRATPADPGSTVSGLMDGTDNDKKFLLVLRPSKPAIPIQSLTYGQFTGTTGAPGNITMTITARTPPIGVFSTYLSSGAIDPRDMTATKDGEINPNTAGYLAWKLYQEGDTPSNVVSGMDDEGDANCLSSIALEWVAASTTLPTALTFVDSAVATSGADITVPAGVQAGDLLVLVDRASIIQGGGGLPTLVTPTGWRVIASINGTNGTDSGIRSNMLAKIANGSDASSTVTGMLGPNQNDNKKILLVFRANVPITAYHVGIASIGSITSLVRGVHATGNPAQMTTRAQIGVPQVQVMVFTEFSSAVSPRTTSVTADGEVAAGTSLYAKYKMYGIAPVNIDFDMDDEGNYNEMLGCAIRVF